MLEKYEPQNVEQKWRDEWERQQLYKFHLGAKKPVFVLDTPPPFPTGEFHMGGVLNWSYMDFAARYKRMKGFEVLFPQGWDCHGFPTEVKVEKKHGKGLPKEEFRKKCLEWTHDVVGTMKPQMKQMGFSIDWSQEYYTIDKDYYRKVQTSLLRMYHAGDVYHAEHPVLFCTFCHSAIAKAEVEDVPRETKLNDLLFRGVDGAPDLVIATTRPELLHATVAVLVHPSDPRYKNAIGKKVKVPVHGQEVPIIADMDVDKDFGSGAVMVSTFGDKQDVIWAYRHKLPVIKTMDHGGRLENAGPFLGMKVAEAKEKILETLKTSGLLLSQKSLVAQSVKIHDRCKHPIEFISSKQWFIKLKGYEEDVRKAAASMTWHPEYARQLLLDWVDGLEWDWCISRQRVFGIPIPFWYCSDCGKIVAPDEKDLPVDPAVQPASQKCPKCRKGLIGETSICDGWVDSSITPLVISGWPDHPERFEKIYPHIIRPQGTDIIRTWAFYTTYRCLRLTGKAPFCEMLINGMVLGNDGKKMSKSLGNYVEAKDVMNKAGVDALRQWAALCGSTGKDNVFYWKDVDYAKSFLNKLWNASKFILNSGDGKIEPKAEENKKASRPKDNPEKTAPKNRAHPNDVHPFDPSRLSVTDHWALSRLHKTIQKATACMDDYQFYEALTAIQSFFWHDVCDHYLEDVKHRTYGENAESKRAAQKTLDEILNATLQMLAPFAPFMTEEIWSATHEGSIHKSHWPSVEKQKIHEDFEALGNALHQAISEVRKFKASKGLALNAPITEVSIKGSDALVKRFADVLDDFKAITKAQKVAFEDMPAAENQWALRVDCTA